jgi:hypothetical protein
LDTRNKILSAAEALERLADGNWLVIAGYFDPLTPSVAQRLHGLLERARNDRVLAVVLHGIDTLLTIEDRSALMAALRDVHAVVSMSESELRAFVPSNPRIRFIFDPSEERRNSEAFAAVVLGKQAPDV